MTNSTVGTCMNDLPLHVTTPLFITLLVSLTLCVLGNSVICLIVARHYQLHTVTNANIVNMAVGHLLLSIFCVPTYLRVLKYKEVPSFLCSAVGFTFTLFATGSTFALMLITFERYHVIVSRRNSARLWTARTATKSILAAWLVACMLSIPWVIMTDEKPCNSFPTNSGQDLIIYRLNQCLPFLNPPSSRTLQIFNVVLVILCFFLPFLIVFLLYCRMAGPLWKGYNQVRPVGGGHPKTIRYTAEIRTTRTMLLMFALFVSCWAIYCYIAIFNSLHRFSKQAFSETLTITSISLAFGSFSLDPIIYTLRNPRISMILRGRKNRKRRVKFTTSEIATDGGGEQTKWRQSRCAVESFFEATTVTSKSDEMRTPSTAHTASSRLSGSVLSFSYHVGDEKEQQIDDLNSIA